MKRHALLFALIFGLASGIAARGAEEISDTRNFLLKWVETRQMSSKLRADWSADKELLADSIRMFEKESANLAELMAKVDAGNDQVRKERDEQQKLDAQYKDAIEKVKSLVVTLERKIGGLAKTFPSPLAEKIDSFAKRIPEDPASTKLPLGQRVQTLVAILAEADKFNNAVTLVTEMRRNDAGKDVQVRTFYLGLAQAFFADKRGTFAGVGQPSADGWKWSNDAKLGPVITKAMAVYENEQPAAFVVLPAKIQ